MRSQLGEVTLLLVTQAARADASADIFLSQKKAQLAFCVTMRCFAFCAIV